MVHVPLYVSDKFQGKSGAGLFGDVMMEIDWSVGKIMEALDKNGLTDNTLVVFTSDNGPWLSYGSHAGSAAPLREGKGTMFEGGYRVCTLMQWPGKIAAGSQCDELCSTIDLLPTIAKLTDAPLSANKIDGKDLRELMFGKPGDETKSPHEYFPCYYKRGELHAVRDRQSHRSFRLRPLSSRIMPVSPSLDRNRRTVHRCTAFYFQRFDIYAEILTCTADPEPHAIRRDCNSKGNTRAVTLSHRQAYQTLTRECLCRQSC